ncbi:MAG: CusA/CzcA family heavy metal efflux RND transporter [Flavobacteriales bacterium]|nr:CusA/CzcA family heavy metal efflux RND transporter [Flavobacteriales bacterium]
MFSRLVNYSIKNNYLVLIGIFLGVIWGIWEARNLAIDAVPDITNNQVQLITTAPAFSAEDMERLVTFPLEQALRNIPGLMEMRSFSRLGLSVITLVFNDETDVYWARQQISERLPQAREQLPAGVAPPFLAPVTTGLGEIFQYVLRPAPGFEKRYDALALRSIQDWVVRRQLLGVPGVADVSSFGGRVLQYVVSYNPAVLKTYGLSPENLAEALNRASGVAGGAYIEKGNRAFFLRADGLFNTPQDIENTVVGISSDGTPIRIRNVAKVHTGFALPYGGMVYNDSLEVAGGIVMMLKGENGNQVVQNVKKRIEEIRSTLPEGVILEPFLDRSRLVGSVLRTVRNNLVEGALIVLGVLSILLGSIRAGLIVASVIPLALLFAVVMMKHFGLSGNLMSLGALDFGLIVDGAVIVVEGVLYGLHTHVSRQMHGSERAFLADIIQKSSGRLLRSAFFGQLIILAVYLPILSLEGIEGKMFRPMALTVIFALAGAFILSFTYVPALTTLVLRRADGHHSEKAEKLLGPLAKFQSKILFFLLRRPYWVVLALLFMLLISVSLIRRMGGEFIPTLPEGDLAIETRLTTGSSLTSSLGTVKQGAALLLKKFPEVLRVVSKTGTGEIPTDPMPMEASDMMVVLRDKSEWVSARTWADLISQIQDCLKGIPGVYFSVQYPVAMRFNELLTGARQDVVCKVFGENLDTLVMLAEQIGQEAEKIPGVASVYIESLKGASEIRVQIQREQAARLGVDMGSLALALSTAFAGQQTGMLFQNERRHPIVLRLDSALRSDLETLERLPVATKAGGWVPLGQVASIYVGEGIHQIQREDARRRIVVGFNVLEADVESVVQQLQRQLSLHPLPAGYTLKIGGAYEHLVSARRRLFLVVPLALAVIFIFLFMAFRSLLPVWIVFLAVPFSAVGGLMALSLRHMPFSISGGVGFVVLFGVSVLNGIVLVNEIRRLMSEEKYSLYRAVFKASQIRLRPILITALVASLGFLPMAISTGNGAEVQRPLATVVIGGLMISTFLTLILLPFFFIIFSKLFKTKTENH